MTVNPPRLYWKLESRKISVSSVRKKAVNPTGRVLLAKSGNEWHQSENV